MGSGLILFQFLKTGLSFLMSGCYNSFWLEQTNPERLDMKMPEGQMPLQKTLL